MNPLRLLSRLAVLSFTLWFLHDKLDGLTYYFSSSSATKLKQTQDWALSIPKKGQYVSLSGVLGQRAATLTGMRPGSFRLGPIQVRQVLGTPVFLEFDQNQYGNQFQAFHPFQAEGRLVEWDPKGPLKSIWDYFAQNHVRMPQKAYLLIVDEKPHTAHRYPLLFLLISLLGLWTFIRLLKDLRNIR